MRSGHLVQEELPGKREVSVPCNPGRTSSAENLSSFWAFSHRRFMKEPVREVHSRPFVPTAPHRQFQPTADFYGSVCIEPGPSFSPQSSLYNATAQVDTRAVPAGIFIHTTSEMTGFWCWPAVAKSEVAIAQRQQRRKLTDGMPCVGGTDS